MKYVSFFIPYIFHFQTRLSTLELRSMGPENTCPRDGVPLVNRTTPKSSLVSTNTPLVTTNSPKTGILLRVGEQVTSHVCGSVGVEWVGILDTFDSESLQLTERVAVCRSVLLGSKFDSTKRKKEMEIQKFKQTNKQNQKQNKDWVRFTIHIGSEALLPSRWSILDTQCDLELTRIFGSVQLSEKTFFNGTDVCLWLGWNGRPGSRQNGRSGVFVIE